MNFLAKELINSGVLKTPAIMDAFDRIDRKDFVPEEIKEQAYLNIPLSISCGQTISQPWTVAFILELLQPEPGNKILEIGYGSGWQTALIASIVGRGGANGRVFAMEIVSELCDFGRKNIAKYDFIKNKTVSLRCVSAGKGWVEEAPFDRIISAASAKEIPLAWKEQLKIGGRMVAPIGNSVFLFIKKGENNFMESEFPGFVFVPFVDK